MNHRGRCPRIFVKAYWLRSKQRAAPTDLANLSGLMGQHKSAEKTISLPKFVNVLMRSCVIAVFYFVRKWLATCPYSAVTVIRYVVYMGMVRYKSKHGAVKISSRTSSLSCVSSKRR